jgi:hypothetical protein
MFYTGDNFSIKNKSFYIAALQHYVIKASSNGQEKKMSAV